MRRGVKVLTSNEGKFRELEALAKGYGIELEWVRTPKWEIQSEDLAEIAKFSAEIAFSTLKEPVIVEDTGLFIDSLNGFPGPYTSYARKTIGLEGILKLMEGKNDRRARFVTYLAYADSINTKVFVGEVRGVIADSIRGSRGFGFDPIFVPEGSDKTFAEMDVEEKNKYSHRAKAFRAFAEFFKSYTLKSP